MRRSIFKLVGSLSALVLASCFRSGESSREDIESIRLGGLRVELEHKVAVAQLKLDRASARALQHSEPVGTYLDLGSRRLQLISTKSEMEAQIADIENEMLVAKASRLEGARGEMVGKDLATLKTTSGRIYDQVKIVAISDSGVQIRHSTGTARLGCSDLTESQWDQFGLDKGLEDAAMHSESIQIASYERATELEPASSRDFKSKSNEAIKPHDVYSRPLQPANPSAFDRRVGLGNSTASSSRRVVARYHADRRTSVYYYSYNPYYRSTASPCQTPLFYKTSSWATGLPTP